MARTGSSSKFVPVNLNNSYGQTLPLSNGGASASSSLGRSRSFTGSYGGMVPLSRSTRVSSSSPSSASVSASSRASKLAVPRPVNLPSLRREHSGNDPTIALVGSSGSSGWTKQTGDEALDVSASRSDSHSTSWGNRPPAPEAATTQIADRMSPQVGRQSVHSPPGPGDAVMQSTPVVKAVVFRGEDFPTLQAAAVPFTPSFPPPSRSRDLLSKQQRDKRSEDPDELKQEPTARDDPRPSNHYFDQQFQPAQPVRMQVRGTFPEHNESNADKGGAYLRGPSPLVKLTHTSNWADDERETLSSFHSQESVQPDWVEPNDGFRPTRNWQMDHNGDIDLRRPILRTGYPVRNEADSSVYMESPLRTSYGKDGDLSRSPLNGGARFELDSRGGFDRMSNGARRNDFLKRGWSFSAAESTLNRDGRFANSSNNGSERENYANGKAFFREGNHVKHDTAGRDMPLRDVRPGMYYQDAGQSQESKFGKDILLGRQGFPGVVSPGPRTGRGPGFPYNGLDVALPSKQQPEMDYRRDKRASGFYGHVHADDPFLGDGISTRPTSLYALQPRIKKTTSKDHDYHDPARESFEAELERVEKMLEQERQRAVEERERAIELARKEQEERERLAREEEEMQIKLEQEAREAAYRAQIEAEDAARRVEETRKAREEEKRVAELEEERRKEAARKKLLELEERMAKRETERKREVAWQSERGSTERGSMLRTVSADTSLEHLDNGRRSAETSREAHWKSGKLDEDDGERLSSMVPLPINSSALPSILRSPRLSPYSKEEKSSSTEGARVLQAWKREALESGHDFRSIQKGTSHLQNDHPQQEHDDRHWGSSFRNAGVRKSTAPTDTNSRSNVDPDAADEGNWWVREAPSNSQHPVEAYPQGADASEYPSYGRLRQSLPKQPRVLPPPPVPTSFRKQFVQRDDTHSGASSLDTERIELASKEELPLTSDESTESHEVDIKESLVTNIQVSEQFDSVHSEEVILSDAGSQFSDDTIEEVVTEAYQEQELHSDAVSETYTEGEVDEISDITEAQESSEDLESQKPTVWEALTGEEKADNNVETLGQAGEDKLEGIQEQHDTGREGFMVFNKIEEEEKIVHECTDSGRNIISSSLVEDVASADVDNVCGTQETEKPIATQSVVGSGFKDRHEPVGNTEELASENIEQDHEIQPFPYQAPFLPVGSGDATQIRHLESLSSRQSLVQQFQQPFSFMAVPLPQSSTLNHVVASVPMLTPVHALPNQQDLPFHLQLGLLPGMPLMPNAIQIGSIQMPLHIHPQIPQLAHVHGQQAPVFQFGQIGPSLPMSQSMPMTHMMQPAVQMQHAIGQVNVTQQHLQADFAGAADTKIDSVDLNAKFGEVATDGTIIVSGGHDQAFKENVEVKQGASTNSEGSQIPAEREAERPVEEAETHSATVAVSKLDGRKISTADTFESSWDGDRDQADVKARPGSKPPRGGRRRASAPRYQGILGRGRGRFHGGQNHFYQAPHLTSENWSEGGPKRFARGKMIRRNYRRAEYRVREPLSNYDGELAGAEISAGPSSNMEESKEAGGYRYVKKGPGSQANNVGEENGQSRSRVTQTLAKEDPPVNQSVTAPTSKTNSLLKKYEMDNTEDAPFRTGVVCVFEQPGIETPNDKDDFIKVRSKRQLLRELREQREKESKIKGTDLGSRDQGSKKQQRSSAKTGINIGMGGANAARNIVKRRPARSAESTASDGKVNTPSLINGANTGISSAAVGKRNLTSPKPGRAASASKVVATTGMESFANFAHDNHASEQLTIAAWGGQRSNQEVVSLTQIQLEEAMKPYRLDAPFSESARLPEKALVPLEPGLYSSSSVAVEKPVITSGPLSSLLAGEKIQFGAVTSPTPIPPNSRSSTSIAAVRTGSPLGFVTDSSHIPGHTSSFVTNFLERPLDATFSSKGDSVNKEDGFEGKVGDLELEAEAEAAASAIVAAAISSEDPIESHTNVHVSEMNAGCNTLTSANPLNAQIQSNSASDNPMVVALPADLSVETPSSLFQGSSMGMGLSNMSGVMLQSLPNGAPPAFPCLEMGTLLRGPVFNFGPREDASLASMEPGLSGWQQRHVGTPDSFYGAPSFLSPAGISSIQGHPHMLVYANPYSPVGQFGQLGVSFMGAAYHPSGKQPDWTHIPLSSGSSGALALNNGDLSAGSNGLIAPQHLNGQRTGVAGSSLMSVAAPPNLFDVGLAAPFQVPQMDGFVQSHWSKAPAPPVHSAPISGSSLPSQVFPLSKPAVDLNMQIHSSRAFSNQLGHPVDASNVFHKPPVVNPASSSSFSSTTADSGAQFPDELGLGDSIPTLQSDAGGGGGALSEAAHANVLTSVETTGIKMQRGRRPPARSLQGNLSSVNNSNSTGADLISAANSQEQTRSGHGGRIGSPSLRTGSLQFAEQRASSKQGLPKESTGSEWLRGSQRKGAAGRVSTSDRGGGPVLPSKLKQIYVAKPAADARKLSAAACT